MLLCNVIENKIINSTKNKEFVKNIRPGIAQDNGRLLKLKKSKVKGVGDLALLSQCHVGAQFHGNSSVSHIGITFDITLSKALDFSSSIALSSEPLNVGDESESIERMFLQFDEKVEALGKMNESGNAFFTSLLDSIHTIEWFKAELKILFCDK